MVQALARLRTQLAEFVNADWESALRKVQQEHQQERVASEEKKNELRIKNSHLVHYWATATGYYVKFCDTG